MHYRMVNGKKQVHWACVDYIVRACCNRFCAKADLPFGLDDFPEGFMERLSKRMEIEIKSYYQNGSGYPYRIQSSYSLDGFKRLSRQR